MTIIEELTIIEEWQVKTIRRRKTNEKNDGSVFGQIRKL